MFAHVCLSSVLSYKVLTGSNIPRYNGGYVMKICPHPMLMMVHYHCCGTSWLCLSILSLPPLHRPKRSSNIFGLRSCYMEGLYIRCQTIASIAMLVSYYRIPILQSNNSYTIFYPTKFNFLKQAFNTRFGTCHIIERAY